MPTRSPLGCLTGCLTRFVLLLAAGVAAGFVFVVAIDYVFAPWSFYLGGQFHVVPGWQGLGTLHTDAGDYVLYVWFTPEPNGRGSMFYFPYFRGNGFLCTPRGERFPMRLSAGLGEHPGTNTNGMRMSMSMYWRPWNYVFKNDNRPRLTFRGRWQNPDLVMDDEGSLSRAFLPDGTVYRGPARNQPRTGKPVTVVFHAVPWSHWWNDCRAQ